MLVKYSDWIMGVGVLGLMVTLITPVPPGVLDVLLALNITFSMLMLLVTMNVRQALDLLLAELERGRADPPAESELGWARTLAIGRFSMGLETSSAVAGGLVDLDVYGLPRDSLDTYRSRVRAISAEQVAEAARDHLHPDRAAIVLVGPAATIVPAVEDLGPVEVVTP